MSWLENLASSSAARLVTSAAKEIFRESTTEVEDPVAILENSNSRIAELEGLVNVYKSEIKNYQDEIGALNLRIESLEIQVLNSQFENEKLLNEKEEHMQELIFQINLLRGEPEGGCVLPSRSFSVSAGKGPHDYPQFTKINESSQSVVSLMEFSQKCKEVEALQRQLEAMREEKCQEVAALQETNALASSRLRQRIASLETQLHGMCQSQQQLAKDPSPSSPVPSVENAVQTDELLPSVASIEYAVQTDEAPVSVNVETLADYEPHESDFTDYNGEDTGESIEVRFQRIRQALASAVALVPPPDGVGGGGGENDVFPSSSPTVVWPPPKPEAQVAVLIAAEAASRQRLMITQSYLEQYIAQQLQKPHAPRGLGEGHSGSLSSKLGEDTDLPEAIVTSCIKLLRRECSLGEFEAYLRPLVEDEKHCDDLLNALRAVLESTPLEKCVSQICDQLEAREAISCTENYCPVAQRLCKLLVEKSRNPLREYLQTGIGELEEEEDRAVAKKFNSLLQESKGIRALYSALSNLLTDPGHTFDLKAYALDEKGLEVVHRVADALPSSDPVERLRECIQCIDASTPHPELKTDLEALSSLVDPTHSHRGDIQRVLKIVQNITDSNSECDTSDLSLEAATIVSCFHDHLTELKKANALRKYLRKVIFNSEKPDLSTLDLSDQALVQKLSELLNSGTHENDSEILIVLELVESMGDSAFEKNVSGLSEAAMAIVDRFMKMSRETYNQKELRNYLTKLVDSKEPDASKLDPPDQIITQKLSSLLSKPAISNSPAESEISTVLRLIKNLPDFAFDVPSTLSEEAAAIVASFQEVMAKDSGLKLDDSGNQEAPKHGPCDQPVPAMLPKSDSFFLELLKDMATSLRNNTLDGLDERVKGASSVLSEKTKKWLSCLVTGIIDLRDKYLQAEKDKVALGQLVRSKHAESQGYHAQLQRLLMERQASGANQSDEVARLTAKIERLEFHLLKTEENQAKEAVVAEEREAEVRAALGRAEAELEAVREAELRAAEAEAVACSERDAARASARAATAELTALRRTAANLQSALDSLQSQKEAEMNATAQHYRLENERLQRDVGGLQSRVKELEEEASRLTGLEACNRSLQEQLDRHSGRLAEAHALARRYEERIQVLKAEKQEMLNELNGKLDKAVMKNLLISCMKLPPAKRPEAFRSLGSVLNFTKEDYHMLGIDEPIATNWRELFWNSGSSSSSKSVSKTEHSFVEMLTSFLEKESSPPNQIRLPTDYLGSRTSFEASNGDFWRKHVAPVFASQSPEVNIPQFPLPPTQRKVSSNENPLLSGLSLANPPSQ